MFLEYVLGKVLGFYAHQLDQPQLVCVDLVKEMVTHYPSLHMPATADYDRHYFKRMVSFYSGLLQWFEPDFAAIVFKRVFIPPTKESV